MAHDNSPSEFGGDPGLVQPFPHEMTAAEKARLDRMQNPLDPLYDPTLTQAKGQSSTEDKF